MFRIKFLVALLASLFFVMGPVPLYADAGNGGENPCVKKAAANACNPCAKKAENACNPCAKDPCAKDPCAKDPCAKDPCAKNPCAKNPCASK